MQAVTAACGPAVDEADDDLRHEPDQPLDLEDVETSGAGLVDGVRGFPLRILVSAASADALVAAGAERPALVLGARTVAGEQHGAHVGRHPGVVERLVQLVDGVRAEGVAHFGTVERHPDDSLGDMPVVGDVGQVLETGNRSPVLRVESHGSEVIGCR